MFETSSASGTVTLPRIKVRPEPSSSKSEPLMSSAASSVHKARCRLMTGDAPSAGSTVIALSRLQLAAISPSAETPGTAGCTGLGLPGSGFMHSALLVASGLVASGLVASGLVASGLVAGECPTVPAEAQPARKNTAAPDAILRLAGIDTRRSLVTRLGCAPAIVGSPVRSVRERTETQSSSPGRNACSTCTVRGRAKDCGSDARTGVLGRAEDRVNALKRLWCWEVAVVTATALTAAGCGHSLRHDAAVQTPATSSLRAPIPTPTMITGPVPIPCPPLQSRSDLVGLGPDS